VLLLSACKKDASKSTQANSTMASKSEHQYFDKLTDSIETVISAKNINPRIVEEKMEDASVLRKGYYLNNDLLKMEVVRIYKKDIYKETFYFKHHKLFSAHIETEQLLPDEKQKEILEKRYYFKQERVFKAIQRRMVVSANGHSKATIESIPFEEEVTNLDQINREMQEKVSTYAEVLGNK
jgi:hypothetical protein